MKARGAALHKFKKVYLGDAVYLELERGQWILSVNDGYRSLHEIYLYDNIMESLIDHVKSYYADRSETKDIDTTIK